jgi:hypothetical protein
MAAKTFEEFWKNESGWYDPNEPQGLSEYVLAQAAWNAAISAEALKPSHNKQSTQWPRLHDIKVAVKPRSAANGSDLHDATVWYMAVKDTYLWLCSHLGHNAH